MNVLKCCKTYENLNESNEKDVEKKSKKKTSKKETKKKIMKKIMKKTNDENMTMINAINENFVMHRRLILTIDMKIDEQKK